MGAPIGTAVGFCFYMGTTFAAAMYILGAVESFITATKIDLGEEELGMRVFSTILLILLVIVNIVSLQFVAKVGTFFLAIVLLSILSIAIGCLT